MNVTNKLKDYKKHKINNPFLRRIMKKTYKLVNKNFEYKERDWIYKKIPKHSRCAEIGVYTGENSLNMLKIIQPKELVLIDPWIHDSDSLKANNTTESGNQQEDYGERYEFTKQRMKDKSNVRIIRGKSQEELEEFSENYFDFIYIDGDHSFEGVLSDLEVSFKKVKKLGIIAGDDYRTGENANVTQQTVARAVKHFVSNHPVKLVYEKNYQFFIIKD